MVRHLPPPPENYNISISAIERNRVVEKFSTNEQNNYLENKNISPEAQKLLNDYEQTLTLKGGSQQGPSPMLSNFIMKMYLQLTGLIKLTGGFYTNGPGIGSGPNKFINKPHVSIKDQFISQNDPSSFKNGQSKQSGLKQTTPNFNEQDETQVSNSLEEIAQEVSNGDNYIGESYEKYTQEQYPSSAPERYDTTDSPTDEIKTLMYDSQRKGYTRTSIDEGRGIIQAKDEGIVQNPQRLSIEEQKQVDLDFRCDGPGNYKFADKKTLISQRGMDSQSQSRTLCEAAFDTGASIMKQKTRFIDNTVPWAPQSPDEVLHIVNLGYLEPVEKASAIENVLRGAELNGGVDYLKDIAFLNNEL